LLEKLILIPAFKARFHSFANAFAHSSQISFSDKFISISGYKLCFHLFDKIFAHSSHIFAFHKTALDQDFNCFLELSTQSLNHSNSKFHVVVV
jgi:hypothetical protein